MHVAFAGMEISWFTLFFLAFVRPARLDPPYLTAALLGGLMLAFYGWTLLAEHYQWELARERLAMLLALPVIILVGWRYYLHPDTALLDLTWIAESGYGLVAGGQGAYWAIMATVLFLWWRGVALSRREFTFDSVSFAFRLGLLLLIIGTVLISYIVGSQVIAFIFPFFFFSLVAVSLARLDEVGRIKGEVGRLFDLYWLTVLAAAILLVLLAGAGLAYIARPEGIETLRAAWAPVGNALIDAITFLLSILLAPFEPLLEWLAQLFARGWQIILEGGFAETLANLQPVVAEEGQEPLAAPYFEIAFDVVRLLCGAGLLLALALAALWVLNQERKRLREQAEEHEALDVNLRDALAGLLRNARDRLRTAAGLVSQFGMSQDLLAAISVRNIYANTIRLARQRGFPRKQAQTPYEYLPALQEAFPQAQAETLAITDAYVGVEYGELPTSREELDALRASYERLRASPALPKEA